MKKILKYPLIWLFFLFLFGYMIFDMSQYHKDFSELENRELAQRPAFTLSSFYNNKFSPKYESYINDQFVLRDQWISLKSRSESLLGKIENNGIMYGEDGYMFQHYTTADTERIATNTGFIGEFVQMYPQLNVMLGIIPNAYMIYPEKVPEGAGQVDQTALTQKIYGQLGSDVDTLDFLTPLQAQKDAYIFYHTDHHWTTLGAYYGYSAFCAQKGWEPVSLDAIPKTDVESFYGTYFSKTKRYDATPDTLCYYDIPVREVTIDGETFDGLYDLEQFQKRDKYAAFLWGNHGITVIKSENNLRQEAGKTSRILVIKDSYGNCFSPFLTYQYDEVYVVDLRSIPVKMSEFLAENEFDDVLILYNFMNFSTDTNLAKLRY
ncbi:MAG: DHHW family protein [Oscillospiraceae bacterium]|nr:DHHW family protein [Oscillospiraceae bacterium]